MGEHVGNTLCLPRIYTNRIINQQFPCFSIISVIQQFECLIIIKTQARLSPSWNYLQKCLARESRDDPSDPLSLPFTIVHHFHLLDLSKSRRESPSIFSNLSLFCDIHFPNDDVRTLHPSVIALVETVVINNHQSTNCCASRSSVVELRHDFFHHRLTENTRSIFSTTQRLRREGFFTAFWL